MLIELLPKLEFRGLSDEDEDEAIVGVPADLDEDEDEDEDDDTAAPDVDDEVAPEEQ
jgi:hypothetical protein